MSLKQNDIFYESAEESNSYKESLRVAYEENYYFGDN
jgi:hypothetical protein